MSLRFKSAADLNAHLNTVRPPKRKYGGEFVELDGYRFDSKWEARRFQELKAMEAAGLITGLVVHPSYALHVGTVRIGAIVPDFEYRRDGEIVIEDTKSPATRKKELYIWKRGHLEAEYGLRITEIVKRRKAR